MTNGEKIVAAAMAWLGTPHINQARIKGIGVDCGMLLIGSLEDAGLVPANSIHIEPYSNEWHLHHSEEWFLRYVEQYCVKVDDMLPGDFLMFQFGRCLSHAGIYIGKNMLIHAVIDQGVILSSMNDVMLYDAHGRYRLRGIYRFEVK
jgi:cell wall-associated NlpC family hydrolase